MLAKKEKRILIKYCLLIIVIENIENLSSLWSLKWAQKVLTFLKKTNVY